MQSTSPKPLSAQDIVQLSQRDRLAIASRIADAISAAHQRGLRYGTLRPSRIVIGGDQSITLIDRPAGDTAGTSSYDSPEQLRGRPFDRRADIWSFGCIVYELLCGAPAFGGDTLEASRAGVLERNPDWSRLPKETPTRIVNLLRHCLQKDPHDRLHDIADARIEIDATLRADTDLMERGWMPPAGSASRLGWIAASALAIANAVLVMGWLRSTASTADGSAATATELRAVVPVVTGTYIIGRGSSVALAPDGSQLVYVAEAQGRTQLFRRPLNQLDAQPIDGTDGAADPFFSPDGAWIGFYAGENVMKVPAAGGAAVTIADAPTQRGLAWGDRDTIFLIPRDNTGVWKVPASGGTLEQVTTLDDGDVSHRWPHVLPGGAALLYTIWDGAWDTAKVAVQPLRDGRIDSTRPRRIIINAGGSARFMPAVTGGMGHLLFARAETVLSVPFDLSRLETVGDPAPVAEGVLTNFSGGAQFAVSPAGVLAYVASPGEPEESELLWVTRDGKTSTAARLPGLGRWYDLSSDGRRVVRYKTDGPSHDVWIDDLSTGSSTQLSHRIKPSTWGPIDRLNAVWSDDSRYVVFAAGQPLNLYSVPADGTGAEQRLTTSANIQWPGSVSPGGRLLAYVENNASSGSDIWLLPIGADGKPGTPRSFLSTPFNESAPMISPDGRWLAYQSNESGRYEVYVQPFPEGGQRIQVSTDQGVYPRWSPRGGELFFRAGGNRQAMAAVTFDARSGPTGTERHLFQIRGVESILEVSPDAQRFLMLRSFARQTPPSQIQLIANWSAGSGR